MNLEEIKEKKQTGDIAKILKIVNARRIDNDEPPYALSTVKHMLNGTRTLREDVEKAATDYYNSLSKLETV